MKLYLKLALKNPGPSAKIRVTLWTATMKLLAPVLTLVFLTLSVKANSTPCFVIADDFHQAYEKARAVFIGEVVKIDKPLTSDVDGPLADRLYRVTFKVEFSWKGAGFREVGLLDLVVLSHQSLDDCFSWGSFSEGKKYLVYANETEDKNLLVALGNRTALLTNASDDLKKLRMRDALLYFPKTLQYGLGEYFRLRTWH